MRAVLASNRAGCDNGSYERIAALARLLSTAASGGCNQFGYHGMWSIFSDPKANAKQRWRYGRTKSEFMHNRVCHHAGTIGRELLQVCEIGLNAGHTALLLLEAAPAARVVSFDLGDMPWARKQAALLSRAYGTRFKAVFGRSNETVPRFVDGQSNGQSNGQRATQCDVAFLDGGKSEAMRLADLRNVRTLARPGALLLFDEITTLACANGEGERVRTCGRKHDAWEGTSYAYHTASREGWVVVDACVWPPGLEDRDGICAARYAAAAGEPLRRP